MKNSMVFGRLYENFSNLLSFRFRYLKDLVPVFNHTCDLLLEKLRQLADGKTDVKMYDQFSKSTLNIIANVSNVGLLMWR